MTREELIAYDRWLTENKWGSSEIITPEQAADLYLAKHPLPPAEGAEAILKKENKKCVCGAELKHRGGFEFWCDNPHCKTAYVLDADGHISESGTAGRKVEQQPTAEGAEARAGEWKLIGHSHQIADTGDYDGYWEITNGKVSIYTQDDDDEALQPIVDALNDSGCKFYLDDANAVENYILRHDIAELKERLAKIEQQPTAEGTEEFLLAQRNGNDDPITVAISKDGWVYKMIVRAMERFATLHSQRIAEKMVSERLRNELMRYDQWLLANDMGQMFDDTMKCVDEYLKTRER